MACIIPSSINEVLAGKITLYPNPAKDFTCLTISGITGNVSLEITDISGKAVMTDNFYAHNQTIKNVDVNNLGKGIYFVHLQAKNSVIMQKLVVN
ncbi:MAG: T9SS type A sorting domain-containing protein [Bacteroidales bacterium]|nr:T9SS type A sorting domain-containing protein [Bacteroidales bacterium]